MDIKINLNKLIGLLTLFGILLLETQFFHLITLTYNNSYRKHLIVFIIAISFFLLLNKFIGYHKFKFNGFVLSFFIIFIIDFLISLYRYNLDIITLFLNSNHYLIIFASYIIVYCMNAIGKNLVLKVFMVFTLISSVLLITQYLLFPSTGFFLAIENQSNFRFGSLRITQGEGLINIVTVLSFGLLLNRDTKSKILPLLTFTFGFLELFLVQKTRMAILCVVLACLVLLIIKYFKNIGKTYLLFILMVFLVFLLQHLGILEKYLSSFTSNSYSFSAQNRNEAIAFYLGQLKEYIIFGMGFPPLDSVLVKGYSGTFYKDDVGIIGYLNTFGTVGLVWYIVLLIALLKVLIKSMILKTVSYNFETLGLVMYVIFTSGTLIITDPQRIIALPILLALFHNNYSFNKDYQKNQRGEIDENRKKLV